MFHVCPGQQWPGFFMLIQIKNTMKKLLLPTALAIGLSAYSQVGIGIGAGTSTKLRPTMELQVGADFGHVSIQGGFNAHLSSRVTDPAIFFGRAGYRLPIGETMIVNAAAGYAYELHSNDLPELNRTGFLASVQIEKQMRFEGGRLYLNTMYVNKTALFTLGIKAILR